MSINPLSGNINNNRNHCKLHDPTYKYGNNIQHILVLKPVNITTSAFLSTQSFKQNKLINKFKKIIKIIDRLIDFQTICGANNVIYVQ